MKKILSLLLFSVFILTSCGQKVPQDIINPDAEYRYFFWATCPHCQELNRIAESRDLYSQISIEKREIYSNAENQALFQELLEEIKPRSQWVPFVYDTVTWEVAVWVKPALELMTSRLWQNSSTSSESETITETEENTSTGTKIQ